MTIFGAFFIYAYIYSPAFVFGLILNLFGNFIFSIFIVFLLLSASFVIYFIGTNFWIIAVTGTAIISILNFPTFLNVSGLYKIAATAVCLAFSFFIPLAISTYVINLENTPAKRQETENFRSRILNEIKTQKIRVSSKQFLNGFSYFGADEIKFLLAVLPNCNFQSFDREMANYAEKMNETGDAIVSRLASKSCQDSDTSRDVMYKILAGLESSKLRPHAQNLNRMVRADVQLPGARQTAAKMGSLGPSQISTLLWMLKNTDVPARQEAIIPAAEGFCRMGPAGASVAHDLVDIARSRSKVEFNNSLGKGYQIDTASLFALTTAMNRIGRSSLTNEYMPLVSSDYKEQVRNQRTGDFDPKYCDIFFK
jgi:hypothetical protein